MPFLKVYISSLFLLCALNAFPQSQNKIIKQTLKEATLNFDHEDYYHAWPLYQKVLNYEPKNEPAGLNSAVCLFNLNYPVDSLVRLIPNLSASSLNDSKFYLAKIKHLQEQFDDAIILLEKYLTSKQKKHLQVNEDPTYLLNVCKNAKAYLKLPHRSVIKNMGAQINSEEADDVPVIVPDESTLYFTSRRQTKPNDKKDVSNRYYEDIYISYKKNSVWENAQNVGSPINTQTHDACVAISPDAQSMIIYRNSPDLRSGDLYLAKMGTEGKWENPVIMGPEINSQFIETSACFTNDTATLYFTSNRPGGYGGKDIYRIKKLPNGKWALPYNLGPDINTLYDEEAPYLHPDETTFYFSSKGHSTMGNYDVFKSTLDGENKFTQPENLGYPINSVADDVNFIMSINGQTGYYSSVRKESFGQSDIYQIDTRFGDNNLVVKHGTAFKKDVPAKIKITLVDNDAGGINGIYYSNPITGKFI
ncbi:MAG: hypothetical protein JWO32_2886, partial [Bacteroidetes bacterium]|nr:hypothetical protein [Bacteroidota bacterium]